MLGKWIPCSERLPRTPDNSLDVKEYLTCKGDTCQMLMFADGWNCHIDFNGEINREHEIKDVDAWMELPKTYAEIRDEV